MIAGIGLRRFWSSTEAKQKPSSFSAREKKQKNRFNYLQKIIKNKKTKRTPLCHGNLRVTVLGFSSRRRLLEKYDGTSSAEIQRHATACGDTNILHYIRRLFFQFLFVFF